MISVITTVKNGAKYIVETLHSVNCQTYRDFEHVIVDDGSTDNTIDCIKRFQIDFPDNRIRIIETSGLGRGYALNLGIEQSRGIWIAIIDADDLWHKDKLSIQSKLLSSEISVVATGHSSFSGAPPSDIDLPNEKNNHVLTIKDFLVRNSICHSSAIIKKEDCVYNVERKSQFDLELWLRLSFLKKKMLKVNTVLTYHRIHPNQHFESRLGKRMAYNSFKLKALYGVKTKKFVPLFLNVLMLASSMVRRP